LAVGRYARRYGVGVLDGIAHELDLGGVRSANHGSSGTMQREIQGAGVPRLNRQALRAR